MLNRSDTLAPHAAQKMPSPTSKRAIGEGENARYGHNSSGLRDRLLILKNAIPLHFAVLFLYVLLLNREGGFVPSNNESLYLLQLAKFWNPNLFSNDWTFSGPLTSHFVFNFVFGPLTLLFPLDWSDSVLVSNPVSPFPIREAFPHSVMEDHGFNSLVAVLRPVDRRG